MYNIVYILISNSQTINLNESHVIDYLRTSQLIGKLDSDFSFSVRPLSIDSNSLNIDKSIFDSEKYAPTILSFFNGSGVLKLLPIDYNIEYTTHHPYNRNNGKYDTQSRISTYT